MEITSTIIKQSIIKKLGVRKKNTPKSKRTIPVDKDLFVKNLIVREVGSEVEEYIKNYASISNEKSFFTKTITRFNIDKLEPGKYESIINLNRINDVRYLNKFFESVNSALPVGGIFISSVEIYTNRKKRILSKLPKPFNSFHYFIDVLYTRVFSKLPVLKKVYFFFSKGYNRVLSKAETFGRLYSCGFEVVAQEFIGNLLYFTAKKLTQPVYDTNPTYGPVIRLKRYGKGGRIFNVYKFRTMHAYSEYLQDYVFKHNNLQEGGKFNDDFRITTEGKFFRKFWIDELPMLINILKGDMKIVGVRPLSRQYFNLYSDELKQKRTKFKPGLVPPFYVDRPKTLEEIMDSEMKYLEAYEKHPLRTDIKYFFKAFYNIIFKHARSA